MQVEIYNQSGEKSGAADVPTGIFDAKWNSALVHQAFVAALGNRRIHRAHTKDRSEVAGGGKKPWQQKHTGRARHGSSRSPLWAGGGITFGPRTERIFSKKLNTKMRRLATLSALSRKYADGEVLLVDRLLVPDQKTKTMAGTIKRLFPHAHSVLCIVAHGNETAFRGGRNLAAVSVVGSRSVNLSDLLSHQFVLIEQAAVADIARLKNS